MKEHVAVNSKKDQVVLTPTSLKVWDISDRMTKQIAKRAFQLFEVTILLRMIKTGRRKSALPRHRQGGLW